MFSPNLLFLLSFLSQQVAAPLFQLLWSNPLESGLALFFSHIPHPIHQQNLSDLTSKYILSVTISHHLTVTTLTQASKAFLLEMLWSRHHSLLLFFYPESWKFTDLISNPSILFLWLQKKYSQSPNYNQNSSKCQALLMFMIPKWWIFSYEQLIEFIRQQHHQPGRILNVALQVWYPH